MYTNNRYADFLPQQELEYFRKKIQDRVPVKPLLQGEHMPAFHIHKKHIIHTGDLLPLQHDPLPVTQLLDQPLAVVFHSRHWNSYGSKLLQELQDVYADIRIMGGQLLLVTTDPKEHFDHLPFATVRDPQNYIARKAGIYSPSDPVWDRLSGIDADVPIPGIYVLGPSLRIAYSATDPLFNQAFPRRELLSAVYDVSQQHTHRMAI